MRAFLAVPVSPAVAQELGHIQHGLERLAITQTFANHYHITLHFFEEIDEQSVQTISHALATYTFAPFTAYLTPPQSFPADKPARIIYVGAGPLSAFDTLNNALHAHLCLTKEPRQFVPHITLCRVKKGRVMESQLHYLVIQHTEWLVNRIVLYKSELTPQGPVYTELAATARNI